MGKDIRNYEFKTQKAQAFVNDKGELKFKGKKKKELEQLKPLFDAILKADTSSTKNKKKLDSDTEKDLMNKLHTLLMADGIVDADELKLGDEFVNSGLSVAEFIDKKITKANSAKETKEVKEEPKTEVKEEPVVQKPVPETIVEEEKEEETTPVVERRPDPRVSQNAFNQAIQNQRMRIQDKKDELTTAFTKEVTVDKGVYLYNVAVQALKDEGIEHPNAKQINDRIAEIALVNDISDVNKVPKGKVIKVGRVGLPVQPAAEASPTVGESPVTKTTVAPSSITVQEKPVSETLTELEYTAEEKVDGEGDNALTYKEWAKEGSTTMYTTEVDGITLTADSLDKLKELKTQFADATITEAPENEADDAKATRQAANLENMKKRIELSGGDLDVIKSVIDELRADGNVNLESEEVQAFVQDLARTKNVEVLTKLLVNSEDNFTNDLIKNEDTAKTVASLYKEIRDKENAGEKLTDDEIALKEFMATKVKNYELYQIAVDSDNDVAEKSIYFNEKSGEIAYSSGDYYANDPKVLDGFVKAINEANAATKNDTIPDDTDEKAKERALAAVFKQYVNTEDKMLANCIASKADALHASKDDVLALVAKSDMFVLDSLNFTPSAEDSPAFNKAVADRVVALYEAGNGDPANMRYLETALANIDAATYDPEEDKQKAKDKVLESFFEVTGEGENKEYTFKPSRRPTYEEVHALYQNTGEPGNDFNQAIAKSVTLEDMGPGQWTAAIEKAGISREHYAELVADMDAEAILDFVKNKMQNSKEVNIPYDAVIDKFPENLAEQTELVAELLQNISEYSVIDDSNRLKLISSIVNADGNLNVPEGVRNNNLIATLPVDCSEGDAKTYFDKVLEKLDSIEDIKDLALRVTDATSQDAIKTKLTEKVNNNKANPDIVLEVMNLGISAIPDMATFVSLDFKNEAWQPEQKVRVFERIFNGGILNSERVEFLSKAVASGLAENKGYKIYQVTGTDYGYDTAWRNTQGTDDEADDTSCIKKISLKGLDKVEEFFNSPKTGNPNITTLLRGTEEGYQNYLNKDNIVTIIRSARNAGNTSIMEQMAGITDDAWYKFGFGDKGTKPGQALMNRVPKAVMRKALEAGLGETKAYKKLADFFGAEGTPKYNQDGTIAQDDTFKFTKNDDPNGEYKKEDAQFLDKLIIDLVTEIVGYNMAI